MPARRGERWRRATALAAALAACLLALLAGRVDGADSGGFRVLDATPRLVDGVYRLDARIDFEFSPEALEAMENGVPLTVVVEMDVVRDRALLDERVTRVRARSRIRRHALSDRYVVTNLGTGASRTYRSLAELREALGRIEGFPMIDAHVLRPGERYRVRVRALLDIEALPSPLRPLAYLSSRWRLRSPWRSWDLPAPEQAR